MLQLEAPEQQEPGRRLSEGLLSEGRLSPLMIDELSATEPTYARLLQETTATPAGPIFRARTSFARPPQVLNEETAHLYDPSELSAPPPPPRKLTLSFEGRICTVMTVEETQPRCMPMSLEPGNDPFIVELSGTVTNGDLRPLGVLGRLGAPEAIVNAFVIKGTEAYPFAFDLFADLGAVGVASRTLLAFDISAYAAVNLQFLGIPAFLVKARGTGELTGTAGLDGAFTFELPHVDGLPGLGPLTNVSFSVATGPNYYMDVLGIHAYIPTGIALYRRGLGPPFMRSMCPGEMFMNLSVPTTSRVLGAMTCPNDKVWMDHRDRANNPDMVDEPSIQYLKLAGWRFDVDLSVARGNQYAGFGLTGFFSMATSAPNGSPNPLSASSRADPCSDFRNPQCIRSMLSGSITVSMAPVLGISALVALSTSGAWVAPIGFSDFALVDPSFSLGLRFGAGTPGFYRLSWSGTMYWRRDGSQSWPAVLFTKGTCTGDTSIYTSNQASGALSAASCDAWPPAIDPGPVNADGSLGAPGNLVMLQSTFLLEMAPHDNQMLTNMMLPKAGVRFAFSRLCVAPKIKRPPSAAAP